MSEAPRPQSLPSRTSPENGPAPDQAARCSALTGTTSVCADQISERPPPAPGRTAQTFGRFGSSAQKSTSANAPLAAI